jgi:hypothetical protein
MDVFGGEFEWDRYTVKFHKARGADHNVHIIYGKNLTDFKMEKSIENTITGVHPYWVDNETQAVMELPEKVVLQSKRSIPYQKITVLDCTSNFVETLDDLATEWIMGTDKEGKALKGEATVKLTLVACKKVSLGFNDFDIEEFEWQEVGDCSSITVKFVYDGTTAINGVADNANATVVARYAADGTRLSAPQKGLNIVKLSNGKTVKYIK